MEQLLAQNEYITDKSQLVDYFFKSYKCQTDFKIGLEYERIGVNPENFKSIPYSGENGVAEFLKKLKQSGSYEEVLEDGNLLGLKGGCCDVSLEPGAQLECSTKPVEKMNELEKIVTESNNKYRVLGQEMGITWIGYGIQPVSTFENIEMIPKKRYDIMSNYLPQKGSKSLVMMKETAGIQTAIDYASEEDAMKKFRVSLAISPYITAMFANSPIRGGKLTDYKSYRAESWLNTDNDRCGLISEEIFEENFEFSDYVEVLLDVPMFFNKTGMTFRDYMSKHRATIDDWMLHMTTFFPEVRLKNFIEIRNCDCQKTGMTLAFSAFIKGIMYNNESMDIAWELVKKQSWQQRNELRNSVPKQGLTGMEDVAKELVSIAERSLGDEAIYLEELKELIYSNKSPADVIIMNWDSVWNRDLKHLINYASL